MVKNLLKNNFSVTVWNRTHAKATLLEKEGARLAATPAELGRNCDVVITMVTAAEDVQSVLFSEQGVVSGIKKNSIIIDMSTIGPTAAKQIGYKLKEKELHFLDAPVTGSTPKAITGELTIFVGGEEAVYHKVKPVLEAMGTNLHYMGPIGSGQAIKLINNHLIAASVIALGEGMLLADAMNISREKVAIVLKTVPAMSGFMNLKLPNFVKNEYPLLFSTANMQKDLKLALQEAMSSDQHLPILKQVVDLYEKATAANLSEHDMSAVVKILEKKMPDV